MIFTLIFYFIFRINIDSGKLIFSFFVMFLLIFELCLFLKPRFIIEKRKELLLLCFTIFLVFLLLEFGLRLRKCEINYEYSSDQREIRYTLLPNKEICRHIADDKIFYYDTNSKGFVDDEFIEDNSSYNIFLLGDSFANCVQTNLSNCVHRKLENDLKNLYSDKIEVLNFGIEGYGALDELAVLKEYNAIYHPKIIIVYFFPFNDFFDNEKYLLYKNDKNYRVKLIIRDYLPKSFAFIYDNSKQASNKLFGDFLLSSDLPEDTERYEVYLQEHFSEKDKKWGRLIETELNALTKINEIASKSNATLIIVTVTTPIQVYDEEWKKILNEYPSLNEKVYNLSKPNDLMRNFAEQNEIYFLDLLPSFKENPKRLHWEKDGHWNDKGQLFAAEKIKEFIINNNLMDQNEL